MPDCYGYSGTVHFNNHYSDRDPSTLFADRSELRNIKQAGDQNVFASVYVPVGYELLLDGESIIKSTEYLNEAGMQKCHNLEGD